MITINVSYSNGVRVTLSDNPKELFVSNGNARYVATEVSTLAGRLHTLAAQLMADAPVHRDRAVTVENIKVSSVDGLPEFAPDDVA